MTDPCACQRRWIVGGLVGIRLLIVRGAESTTLTPKTGPGTVLAYVVVMTSPAVPGFGSKIVPSILTVTVWNTGAPTRGNTWSAEPNVSCPGTELLSVPATSRRPNARCGLTGG